MKETFNTFLCGLNEISFTNEELSNLNVIRTITDIPFRLENENHLNILKAVYFKYFVQYEQKSKKK